MPTTLGFTGDVMLGRIVDERQTTRPVDAVWGDVLDHLQACDGLFVNLECALSTGGRPWTETYRPFLFRADPDWAVPALADAGVDCAALANNHLMDFGPEALLDTVDALDGAEIAHAGAGTHVRAAREPTVVEVDGLSVGVVSFTDNTPEYAASENRPGVAYASLDPDDEEALAVVGDALAVVRDRDPDLVVASMHWGPNMTTRPTVERRRFARWLRSQGVDVVHGHSAHLFHGVEAGDDGLVLYDCGDFVDDYHVDESLRNDRSFLFRVTVEDGDLTECRLLPTRIADCAVHQARSVDWWHETMRERSREFGTTFEADGRELVVSL